MAWKKSSKHASTASQVVPLVVLFLVVGGIAFLGYQIYLGVAKIQEQANKKIEDKHIHFTKDGMKVSVKHIDSEKYVDATQRVFVDAWNKSGGQAPVQEERKRFFSRSK